MYGLFAGLIDFVCQKFRFELMINRVSQCKLHEYKNEKGLWSIYDILLRNFVKGDNEISEKAQKSLESFFGIPACSKQVLNQEGEHGFQSSLLSFLT
jgi:hypothetical protein